MWRHCVRPYADAQCHNRITYCTPDDHTACYRDPGSGYHARTQRGYCNPHAHHL